MRAPIRTPSPRRTRKLCIPARAGLALPQRQSRMSIAAVGADQRQPHVVGLDRERGTQIGNLKCGHIRRVTHQHIGGAQADRIERAADRNAEMLVAMPAQILDSRQQARRNNNQRGFMRPLPDLVGRRDLESAFGSSAARFSYSGTKPVEAHLVARRKQCLRFRDGSHSRTGERPIRCHPHGVSIGKMQVMSLRWQASLLGIRSRGDSRRGSASSGGRSPM